MTENIPQAPQGEFVLFTSADGQTRVECPLNLIRCGFLRLQ